MCADGVVKAAQKKPFLLAGKIRLLPRGRRRSFLALGPLFHCFALFHFVAFLSCGQRDRPNSSVNFLISLSSACHTHEPLPIASQAIRKSRRARTQQRQSNYVAKRNSALVALLRGGGGDVALLTVAKNPHCPVDRSSPRSHPNNMGGTH